jgi:restriction system protein
MNSQIDLTKALAPLITNWPSFLGIFVIFIVIKILSSAHFKGWNGERGVRRGLARLDPSIYDTFHDLYVPRTDGQGSTQIDHVTISPFGIFVIETKNYKGWIFGSEKQKNWTQQIYRRKDKFQNPLHQNKLHVHALMSFLGLPRESFKPLVFFIGDAVFKTPMPENVLNDGLCSWIGNHQTPIFSTAETETFRVALALHEQNTNRRAAKRQHLKDMRTRRNL